MDRIKLQSLIVFFCAGLFLGLSGCSETVKKPTRQYSFSCSKARTQAERIVCSSDDLRALDSKMTSRYQRAMARVAYPERLKDDQRHWISEVRNSCDTRRCLYSAYYERIDDLQAALARGSERSELGGSRARLRYDSDSDWYSSSRSDGFYSGDDREWQGKWTKESYFSDGGGMLRVKQINGQRLSFRLLSSGDRGRGEVMGEARIDGTYALYKDRSGGCEVEMYLRGKSIEINASKACQRYGDGRFDFNGVYRKE